MTRLHRARIHRARRHRSRLGTVGLFARSIAASPGPSALLALLVAVAAFAAVLVPRAVEALHTSSLHERLGAMTAFELDPAVEFGERPALGPSTAGTTLEPDVDANWGAQEERLHERLDQLPEPLRSKLGDPLVFLSSGPSRALAADASPQGRVDRIMPGVDPRMREHLRLVEGAWPAPIPGPPPVAGDPTAMDEWPPQAPAITAPVELLLTTAVADRMAWPVGEPRTADLGGLGSMPVVLVGIADAIDPDDGFWTHAHAALEPTVITRGDAPPEITGVAFVDPASWTHLQHQPLPSKTSAWFPVDADAIDSAELAVLRGQLGEFQSSVFSLGDGSWNGTYGIVGDVGFAGGLRDLLAEQAAEQAAVDAVLATIVSGPAGVLVAVIVLGASVVFERRRSGLELAAARGADDARLRGILGAEGLAIGIPAAVAGGILAVAVSPATTAWGGWVVAAVFAATPALLLVARAHTLSPLRRARADLGAAPSRLRWVWEALVVVLAAVAVGLLLLGRTGAVGGTPDEAASGIDPLLAAVPLLIALAGCVVVLRLYPLPLAALVRRAKAGRSLVPFLGAARALRDPAAGLVPVLAVVVGVAVAVCSTVVLSTVDAGVSRVAAERVGADAILHEVPLTKEQQAAIADLPGVEATAAAYSVRSVELEVDGRRETPVLIVVDVDDLGVVQAGEPEALALPDGLVSTADTGDDESPVPVVVSSLVADELEEAADVSMGGREITVAGVVDARTPFSSRTAWILIDRSVAEPFADTFVPRQVLIRYAPGADREAVAADILGIAGSGVLDEPADLADGYADRPAMRGLTATLVAALALTAALTALALALTLVVGRPGRERLLPLLGSLGLGRRDARWLVVWEIAPVTAVAVVVGAALGILIPYAVLPGIDLTRFTTGDDPPTITVDPVLVAGVVVGFAVVAAAAAVVAAGTGRRLDAAQALRKEED
ncbi:FtsX-like permease family protein [Agromyces sp. LHK192]|uniref:FtsX-like permease family protein n=1 Tax=Agromyces sp. LHK192 TaxID=2498704 RepID=UPI000FDAEFD5|nr:FtsX-like permease family protein [Agromyces sp. LHK192]